MSNNELERRQTAAADRITGTWFCAGGHHHARGEPVIYRGQRICPSCIEKIMARRRK